MNMLYSLLGTLIALGVLISFHEFGHFWIARRCGVQVLRFSIGFGRPLLRWYDRKGTEFVIAAIPLGGYVRMLDSRESDNKTDNAFDVQPIKKRMAIVAAGPIANMVLAVFLLWLVALLGKEQPRPILGDIERGSLAEQVGLPVGGEIIAVDGEATPTWQSIALKLFAHVGEEGVLQLDVRTSGNSVAQEFLVPFTQALWNTSISDPVLALGIRPWQPIIYPQLEQIEPNSPAGKAGFQIGDVLRSMNGESINDWRDFVQRVRSLPATEIKIEFQRANQILFVSVMLAARPSPSNAAENIGYFGAGVQAVHWPAEMLRDNSFDPISAVPQALKQAWLVTEMTFGSISKMLQGALSVKNLSGPITIAKVAGDSARAGLVDFLGFMALLSISLAVLNVLPIPTLDGGHLLFQFVELVTGRPISENVQAICMKIGAFLIFSLMFLAILNDVSRL